MKNQKVRKNHFGYYELVQKPLQKDLESYYSKKYYQEGKGTYISSYSKEEIKFFYNKIEQKFLIIEKYFNTSGSNFLDIGSGEGWALKYFKKKGWKITGLDFTNFSCKKFNPDCLSSMTLGDIYDSLEILVSKRKKFDIIWMDHILEHVLDPEKLLRVCRQLVSKRGAIMIQVPNDFSILQKYLIRRKLVNKKYWIAPPDHISYFNIKSLETLCKYVGLKKIQLITDFPIDINLLNNNSNYINNPELGKSSHLARVEFENLIHKISKERTIELYSSFANLGLGREIAGFFKLN
jgi:2-polyprenyl-3-methyl-5-hydroxy-6-metoxy-1,4-benzoquinol methylase